MFSLLAFLAFQIADTPVKASVSGAACVIAAKDSSDQSKAGAHVVCDGEGDQEEINNAIRALPEVGGRVLLMEGTFDIRRVEGALGGAPRLLLGAGHVAGILAPGRAGAAA